MSGSACWLHPFSYSNLISTKTGQPSYQLVQGLYGMANGGLLGKGLGGGQPFWTPLVQSDLIFTAFGEELGLAGVMALLLLYGLFVQRGLRTALLAKDEYSKLLASGLAFMFALQVFVIVGGVTRVIPLHRHHHAVPLPGRVQPGGELAAGRRDRADERRRATPGAAADSGRGDDSGGVAAVNQLKRDLNRPIKRVSIAVLILFLILLVNVNYLQAVDAPSLANGPLNDRTEYNQSQVQRGDIVTKDGVTIAGTKPATGAFKYQRTYADGPAYAPVTGYDTIFTAAQAPNYATGVERAENDLLSGTGNQLAFRNFIDMITNKPQKGAHGRGHDQLQDPADRLPAAAADPAGQDDQRRAAGRRRGRAQPVHRRDPGDGLLPQLRPEPAGGARTRGPRATWSSPSWPASTQAR